MIWIYKLKIFSCSKYQPTNYCFHVPATTHSRRIQTARTIDCGTIFVSFPQLCKKPRGSFLADVFWYLLLQGVTVEDICNETSGLTGGVFQIHLHVVHILFMQIFPCHAFSTEACTRYVWQGSSNLHQHVKLITDRLVQSMLWKCMVYVAIANSHLDLNFNLIEKSTYWVLGHVQLIILIL